MAWLIVDGWIEGRMRVDRGKAEGETVNVGADAEVGYEIMWFMSDGSGV